MNQRTILAALLAAAVVLPSRPVVGAEGEFVLVSDRVDGVHRDLVADIAPIQQGGLTVQLSSPSHELEVLSHQILLRPDGEGGHDVRVRAVYRGKARLVARIDLMGLPGQLEDDVTVPEQETDSAARLRFERSPEGYRIEVLEAPQHVRIAIQSRLGEQLVGLCRALTALSFGDSGCDGLERSLSTLRLPLPPSGKSYLVDPSELSDSERRQLDEYLDRH